MLSPEMLNPKFPFPGGGWGGGRQIGGQLLMLSPEMLKSKNPISGRGGGGGGWRPTYDAESRNAKIQIFHFWGVGVGSQLF